MEAVVSPFDAMRRSRIPVRVVIHSSLVSTIFSRSAFVSVAAGTSWPQPVMCVVRFGICALPVVPPMRCSLMTRLRSRLKLNDRRLGLHNATVLGDDACNAPRLVRLDLIEEFHRLDQADRLAHRNGVAHLHHCVGTR